MITKTQTHKTYILILEHTVNKLLRILQRKREREIRAVDLYINYNTLPLSSLFKLRILKFVQLFKFRRDKLPVVFYNYFISNSGVHNYSTRQRDEYHLYKIPLRWPACYACISGSLSCCKLLFVV